MSRFHVAGAALILTAALTTTTPTEAGSNPIPGVDIIVRKNPGGTAMVVGSVGSNGAFRGEIKLPAGSYIIYTACSPRVRCRANELASLIVDGRSIPIVPASGAGGTRSDDFVNQGLITNSNNKLVRVSGTIRFRR
jgi:hypothetical protein